MGSGLRVGVDLGGSKIEVIAVDSEGNERVRRRMPTPAGDYRATVRAVADLVLAVERRLGMRATVGVAMPGTLSPGTGQIKNANSVCLIGQELDKDLGRLLERPVRLANDANCLALSEAVDGAAAGADVVFGVILGTGVGGGIVIGGREVVGANGIAGEWGHNPLPWPRPEEWPGPDCYCARSGCIETFLSGPGMARDHLLHTGEERVAVEIAARAVGGDAGAQATIKRYEERLARALASVINVLDPDVIVLGGGVSRIERLYDTVPRLWRRWVFSDEILTKLVPAAHGDSSGVRGAAWLWPPRR